MIKNYFKTAWRSLKGSKFYSIINISGLACGLATAILLLLWVQHEKSYDRFHSGYSRIYRVLAHFEANGEEMVWDGMPGPLSVLSRSIPSVASLVRINDEVDQVLANADRSKIMDGFHTAYVDSSFFTLFDFEFLQGHDARPLPNNNSVVITRSTANRLFGDDDVLGEGLQFRGDNFTITGILHDFPDNSSMQFDAVFPMGSYAQLFTARGGNGDWKTIDEDMGNYVFKTYVKLHEGADPGITGRDFTTLHTEARDGDSSTRFGLQALADMHLVSPDGNDAAAKMVRIFLIVAILILAIAAVNYVNLSTARALTRAREVSIRKIIGAGRKQLFFQFVLETAMLFSLALLAAIGLAFALLPAYNLITGKTLQLSLTDASIWKTIGYAALGTLLAASIYPALLLSDFHPLRALKGKVASGIGNDLFRKALVVFQFSISIVLVVATLVIGRQLNYVRKMDLGYDKSYVFSVPLPNTVAGHIDALKNELTGQHGIINVSLTDIYDIANHESASSDLEWAGKPEGSQSMITQAVIDEDFIPTMKMELLEGRNFTGTPADSNLYIINEAAVKKMGLKPPYAGQTIRFHGRKGTIIGVVGDFNYKSLKEEIAPLLFFRWWPGNVLYVRTTAQDAQQAITAVEQQYKKYAGDIPFSYSFLDKQFEARYISDRRAGLLFNSFAGIAIFISCLGLLGLSTYTVRQRVKEIGIRKVLGASVGSVVQLLAKGSVLLVTVSIVIAIPVAWFAMSRWLEDFAYRIDIEWWMFALAGLLAVAVALLTVSFQSVKAALMNPVKSLKSE
ncbi:putative permease [Anseongella ginsenosidimutans]|uniref:Putative permease n=1 Tax=Anseongella ginsenosidimutans TaxID=496056 RepID=A0A4R3KN08_9SPHI|nr:ABC transporter permease [Anseongella ginsenosidimutans]QEC51920.1 FtsX-like permease family protein [Anseongella ginsenosidimutans]TCS85054.1 putative permease [Anseongella ginsenosidimutans]